jgi:hypothetical protein
VGLARVIARRIDRDPRLDGQQGVAELAELLVVARHGEIGDARYVLLVAEELERGAVVADGLLVEAGAVIGEPAQIVAAVVERLEGDQVRSIPRLNRINIATRFVG